ncbi:DUF4393 domain-containing protein [Gemella sp. GH3]|uniref:DUF4393 domain-containing protein n=1 Tax=unclassified Gemella TaxID=2624949 RepID=UPI0015D0A017|nr:MULTISPECIES: DUF4393 domain-containing protein [unclassified Gemella]MBF0714533.1 DUF4393 domain-containing protein [Gemella sp. GH3.1]NYS51485.1 DUF4393 domain-containing protein [Gemella sp. GH3]
MSELTNIIVSTLGSAALTTISKGPTETLSQWWYYNFGYKSDIKYLQKKKEVETLYKKNIVDEVLKIPDENIQEPRMNILGPALEASKYYIDDEELRLLFSKLVASSMDNSKNNISQPAFVEIIKQMTPLDAQNLISLYKRNSKNAMVTSIHLIDKDTNNYSIIFEHFYLYNNNSTNYYQIATSLVNLKRLGLINIDYSIHLSDKERYNIFEKNLFYLEIKNSINKTENQEVILQKGLITITNFGLDFCEICL